MKLEDINQTTFAALDPEIQSQLIQAAELNPIMIIAFVILMITPMLFIR